MADSCSSTTDKSFVKRSANVGFSRWECEVWEVRVDFAIIEFADFLTNGDRASGTVCPSAHRLDDTE